MSEKTVGYLKEDQEKKEELDRSWSELVPELLCLVSSHLLGGDFINFRAVCKSWRSSTSLIRPVQPLIDYPSSLFSCLMSIDYNKCRLYHPTYFGTGQADIPEFSGAHIRFSKYGWLLLTRDDGSIFFFNPFTKAKLELPQYPEDKLFETMCFSSPPTSSDCFILGFCYPDVFGMIKRGEEHWSFREITGRFLEGSSCNPVLYKGLCYCLDLEAHVGVFDPNGEPCQWTVYAPTTPLPQRLLLDSVRQHYLVDSDDGKLLAVFMVVEEEAPIYIFAMNLSNLRQKKGSKLWKIDWRRVRSLENRMLYISLAGSFVEPTVARGTGNKIYLPMIRDNKNVFYALNTAMFRSFTGDYLSKNPFHVKELQNCCWIKAMPTVAFNQDFEW